MKTKFLILAITILVLSTSCKNDKKTETSKTDVKDNFSVEMNITAQTLDDFTVYYTEDNTNDFSGEKTIWRGIKGGLIPEKVVFDLPEDVIPTNIRLDFGIKKDHKDVVVQNIKLAFHDKVFNIKGSDLLNYFIINDKIQTTIDAANGTITLKIDPAKNDGTYYYPKQELLDQIAKMSL